MRFGLAKEHHDFFHHHHFVEFEDLLTSEEVDGIEESTGSTKHDLWRTDDRIKKIVLRPTLAEVASNLSKKYPIRIGYDLLIDGPISEKSLNLIEMSSIRKVVCGLVIQLSNYDGEDPIVPKKKGSGIYFNPFFPLSFPEGCHLLLIAYAADVAIYIPEKRDPNLHALKKLRYGFGDHLRSETHPIVYKR